MTKDELIIKLEKLILQIAEIENENTFLKQQLSKQPIEQPEIKFPTDDIINREFSDAWNRHEVYYQRRAIKWAINWIKENNK